MKWDFNKQVSTIIIVFIVIFGLSMAWIFSPTNFNLGVDVTMNDNALEAVMATLAWDQAKYYNGTYYNSSYESVGLCKELLLNGSLSEVVFVCP